MERRWVTSPSYKAAIRIIIDARNELGLTQRDLAERLGKPRSFVSKIETRERRLDFVEFVAVARALGVDPGLLVDRVIAALGREIEI
jgi:transcriptional regulator with XRE-family HTH domain